MGLQADLTGKLDAKSLVDGLIADVAGPLAQLTGIEVPANAEQLGQVSDLGGGLDTGSITGSITGIAGAVLPQLESLPGAGDVIRPITGALEIVENVTSGDLVPNITALVERLIGELEGEGDGSFVARMIRVSEILAEAPEGQLLASLLSSLVGDASVKPLAAIRSVGELAPAVNGAISAVAGLMTLESVLSESERLMGIVAGQLDGDELKQQLDALVACFAPEGDPLATPLVELATRVIASDEAAVRELIIQISICAGQLESVERRFAESMGFGEATLEYLGVDAVQSEVTAAATMVRDAALGPLENLLASAYEKLRPFVELDLEAAPNHVLDDLLTTVEGTLSQYVAEIENFDSAAVVSPLTDGLGQVTGIFDKVAETLTSVTVAVTSALEQVKNVLAQLPFDEIATAIQTALGPITTVLDGISDLIDTIEAALDTAAGTATTAIETVEGFIDDFIEQVDGLFDQAHEFVVDLNLEGIIGEIGDNIKAFADLIAKADMKPYFGHRGGRHRDHRRRHRRGAVRAFCPSR